MKMDYKQSLEQLENLRSLLDKYNLGKFEPDNERNELHQQICNKYGEVEDIIEQFLGRSEIRVKWHGCEDPLIYPNYIEAGYLSGRSMYQHQGYTQLLKVIGKLKQRLEGPNVVRDEQSLSGVVRVLNRFRECCQYLTSTPSNEGDVQDIIWIMLRSHFDRVDREETLPKFGVKGYKPDFGIPELYTLVEVKFIGEKSNISSIQEEIIADIPPYLSKPSLYRGLIIFVYDAAHKLLDDRRFKDDIRTIDGVVDVIVVPGIGYLADNT